MKDALGNRMKEYESVTRYKLSRRAYTMIRIDGKAFHTYTKGLKKPFDWGLIDDMDKTAMYLCKNLQNAVCAFVQSDEISILLCDFQKINTSALFDNVVQKICSVSASMATAKFNQLRMFREASKEKDHSLSSMAESAWDNDNISSSDIINFNLGMFDSRVYQLPNKGEVMNYFIWRQQDTVKNSISSVAQTMFSHKQLHGKNGNDKQEMMFQKDGTNWNDFDPKVKRGRMIIKETYEKEPITISPESGKDKPVLRTRWTSVAPPTFTKDKDYLSEIIPDRDVITQRPIKFIPNEFTGEEIESIINILKKQKEFYG